MLYSHVVLNRPIPSNSITSQDFCTYRYMMVLLLRLIWLLRPGLVVAMCRDYKEYHTDTTVRFVISMAAEKMQAASSAGLFKKFKLEGSLSIANMVCGCSAEMKFMSIE